MKTLYLIIALAFMAINVNAQCPDNTFFQTILTEVEDGVTVVVKDQDFRMRLSIIKGDASSDPIYTEIHMSTTDADGNLTVKVGSGAVLFGNYSTINFSDGPYHVLAEVDTDGEKDPITENYNYTFSEVQTLELIDPHLCDLNECIIGYQAVIRDEDGVLYRDKPLTIKLSIVLDTIAGYTVRGSEYKGLRTIYSELHETTTNMNGLVSIDLGNGEYIGGYVDHYNKIPWSRGLYFIETEVTFEEGPSPTIRDTSQIKNVPFAIYAKTSGSGGEGGRGEAGPSGPPGADGEDGRDGYDGLPCWDLDGDGRVDTNEDFNGDGVVNSGDCRGRDGEDGLDGRDGEDGADGRDGRDGIDGSDGEDGRDGRDGVSCWDSNGNGVGDPGEDTNGDGTYDVQDCQNGSDGRDGINCYDRDGDGAISIEDDLNGDGTVDALDCIGISCWDIDGDGEADAFEDLNGDGFIDIFDCSSNGQNCWDLNGNGLFDVAEDTNGDGTIDIFDCRGDGGQGTEFAINCWDLNRDGLPTFPDEDTNFDGIVNIEDCRGDDGIACWDLNGNGIGDLGTEDRNFDDVVDARDCCVVCYDPQDPYGGQNGINCWDLNGNGLNDVAEDSNGDGQFNALDCQGEDGIQGADGIPGANGVAGANGINCWDLNGNGIDDDLEDRNGDGIWDAQDCQPVVVRIWDDSSSVYCWDTNGNGIRDDGEDINGDGSWDAFDCRGEDGEKGNDGGNGINCWDLNGNGANDASEDRNGDGVYDAYDCGGSGDGGDGRPGRDGVNCWDLDGDGEADPSEDRNGDGTVDANDCQGEEGLEGPQGDQGPRGRTGINCWDKNQNGEDDDDEDVNGDGFFDVFDCCAQCEVVITGTTDVEQDVVRGPAGFNGADGRDGLNCWDTNNDRIANTSEDVNGDGEINAEDCKGEDGRDGYPGQRGYDGPEGPAGPSGARGPTGPPGVAGTNGLNGAKGEDGARGPAGADGAHGLSGAPGPVGPMGPTGHTGPPGMSGLNGVPGPVGPVGPMGPAGKCDCPGNSGGNGNGGGFITDGTLNNTIGAVVLDNGNTKNGETFNIKWNPKSQWYEVGLKSGKFSLDKMNATVNPISSTPRIATVQEINGKLIIQIFDLTGTSVKSGFTFNILEFASLTASVK